MVRKIDSEDRSHLERSTVASLLSLKLKGGRTSSGAWAGSVARGFISETKLATELEQRPTEKPMPLQHAAANSCL